MERLLSTDLTTDGRACDGTGDVLVTSLIIHICEDVSDAPLLSFAGSAELILHAAVLTYEWLVG